MGGLAAGTAVGIEPALGMPLEFEWWQGALIGGITSIAAQAGDLVESGLKRDARVKDAAARSARTAEYWTGSTAISSARARVLFRALDFRHRPLHGTLQVP